MKRTYGRVFQKGMKLATNALNFHEPILLNGLESIAKIIKEEEKLDSVLIVTDDFLHNKAKLIEDLKKDLEKNDIKYAVYDKTIPNPTIDNIEEALKMYYDNKCQGFIAVGGGSPMDCAKGVACRVARPDKQIPQMKGVLKVLKKIPPFFAVPTTSGTGSEATIAAVVSNSKTHEKYAINDPVIIPKYAVLDPKLTVGLPNFITSTTGMDALTHAVEAYIGGSNTKKTKRMAIKATKLIFDNLKNAYDDGTNIEARRNMQIAAYCAGIAFTRAYVGCVHAIAHSLGGMYSAPHGDANSIVLPYILDFYGASAYKKLAELADVVDIKGKDDEEKAKAFIQAIRDMNSAMNIPSNVNEIKKIKEIGGIKDEDIPIMAGRAYAESYPLYPVPKMMDKKDLERMYYIIQEKEPK
ncbi:MAG: iron-containing alcohol dehydrogenase [Clostridia bacterium]